MHHGITETDSKLKNIYHAIYFEEFWKFLENITLSQNYLLEEKSISITLVDVTPFFIFHI